MGNQGRDLGEGPPRRKQRGKFSQFVWFSRQKISLKKKLTEKFKKEKKNLWEKYFGQKNKILGKKMWWQKKFGGLKNAAWKNLLSGQKKLASKNFI